MDWTLHYAYRRHQDSRTKQAITRTYYNKTTIEIGRRSSNDLVYPYGNCSKRHTQLVWQEGKVVCVDLKSTNGTYVNGQKVVGSSVFGLGDKLYLGDWMIWMEELPVVPRPGRRHPNHKPPCFEGFDAENESRHQEPFLSHAPLYWTFWREKGEELQTGTFWNREEIALQSEIFLFQNHRPSPRAPRLRWVPEEGRTVVDMSSSQQPVMLNGEPVVETTEVKCRDILTLGDWSVWFQFLPSYYEPTLA